MSYESTVCPCGGKKMSNTMLCCTCETAYAEHPAMSVFKDESCDLESRRHAAITLVTLARGRNGRV